MSTVRFFMDEDVYGAVASVLRRNGFDAVSTPEAGRLGESDESQLTWAAQQGRVLVTLNVSHFASQHSAWMRSGQHHAGIVVSQQRAIGDVVRRLTHVAKSLAAEEMVDRLEFLSDW